MSGFDLSPSQKDLLHLLLDRMEGSNTLERMISVRITEERFPVYYDDSNPQALRNWEREVTSLEAQGWIEIDRGKGADAHRILRVRLNRGFETTIATALKRWNLNQWQEEMQQLYGRYLSDARSNHTLYPKGWVKFLDLKMNSIQKLRPSYEKRTEVKEETELLLAALEKIICPSSRTSYGKAPLTWRQFAVFEFGDSKKLNSIKSKVLRHLYEIVAPTLENLDLAILDEFGIEAKEELLMLAGPFSARGSTKKSPLHIDGHHWRPFVAIPRSMVKEHAFTWDFSLASGVLTIENEEVFQSWCRVQNASPHTSTLIALYIGGFPSRFKIDFLKTIPSHYPFHHWGDLDVGGIQIFRYLERELNREIRPYRMGPELLEKHKISTQGLEVSEVQRLETILKELPMTHALRSLIEEMIRKKLKLEQEAVM